MNMAGSESCVSRSSGATDLNITFPRTIDVLALVDNCKIRPFHLRLVALCNAA